MVTWLEARSDWEGSVGNQLRSHEKSTHTNTNIRWRLCVWMQCIQQAKIGDKIKVAKEPKSLIYYWAMYFYYAIVLLVCMLHACQSGLKWNNREREREREIISFLFSVQMRALWTQWHEIRNEKKRIEIENEAVEIEETANKTILTEKNQYTQCRFLAWKFFRWIERNWNGKKGFRVYEFFFSSSFSN